MREVDRKMERMKTEGERLSKRERYYLKFNQICEQFPRVGFEPAIPDLEDRHARERDRVNGKAAK